MLFLLVIAYINILKYLYWLAKCVISRQKKSYYENARQITCFHKEKVTIHKTWLFESENQDLLSDICCKKKKDLFFFYSYYFFFGERLLLTRLSWHFGMFQYNSTKAFNRVVLLSKFVSLLQIFCRNKLQNTNNRDYYMPCSNYRALSLKIFKETTLCCWLTIKRESFLFLIWLELWLVSIVWLRLSFFSKRFVRVHIVQPYRFQFLC